MHDRSVYNLPNHANRYKRSYHASSVKNVEIFANLGWDNQEAGAPVRLAANWLKIQISSGAIPVDLEKFEEELVRLEKCKDLVAKIGFDCMDKAAWTKAFSEFEPHLPRGCRTSDPHKFLSHIFATLSNIPHTDSSLVCGSKAVELFMKELGK